MPIVAALPLIAKAALVRRAVKLLLAAVPVVVGAWLTTTMLLAMMFVGGRTVPTAQAAPTSRQPATAAYGCNQGRAGTAASLDATQTQNAATIIAVGKRLNVPPFGWAVAIATAMTESGMRALPYGDRDSVGIFQQRDAWGTTAQRMDPASSAAMFYTGGHAGQRGLLDIPGWASMPLTVAAQTVQVSAFPNAYAVFGALAASVVGNPALAGSSCKSETDREAIR